MNEEELQTLIVRLLGDSTDVDEMLKRIAANTANASQQMSAAMQRGEQVTRSVETATEKYNRTVGDLGDLLSKGTISQETFIRTIDRARQELANSGEQAGKLQTTFKNLATAAVELSVAIGAEEILRRAFYAYSELESTTIRLTNTMRANGEAVSGTMQKYQQFADEIQHTTTTSNIATYSLIQQAEAMGKTGDRAIKLAEDSIAFGAATGQSAESGFHLALAMEMGNTQMLRYGLGLRGVRDEAEILRIAHLRLLAGMNIQQEQAQTAFGRITQLSNSYKRLQQEIGDVVAKALKPLIETLLHIIDGFNNLDRPTKTIIVTLGVIALATVAVTAALAANAVIVQQVTAAWAALDAVIIANPIGLALAAIGLGIIAIYGVMEAFNDTSEATEKASKRLDEYRDKLGKIVADDVKIYDTLEKAAPIQDVNKGQDRSNYFATQRLAAESREKELKAELKKQQDAMNAMREHNDSWMPGTNYSKEQIDQQMAAVNSINERAKVAHDAAVKAGEEADKAADPNKAAADNLKKLKDEYIELNEVAGKVGTAKKLAPLEMQGVSEDKLEPIREAAAAAEMKKVTAAQKEQIETQGMSKYAKEAYNQVHHEYVSQLDAEANAIRQANIDTDQELLTLKRAGEVTNMTKIQQKEYNDVKYGGIDAAKAHAIALQTETNAIKTETAANNDAIVEGLLSANALAVYKHARDGATAADLAALIASQRNKDASKEQGDKLKELDALYDSTAKSAREFAYTLNMTEGQKLAWKFDDLGAKQEDVDKFAKLGQLKDAQKIIEGLETPMDKFSKQQVQLKSLFDSGGISAQVYSYQMQKVAKETIGASNAMKVLQQTKQSLYGSAEAQQKVEEYKQKVLGVGDNLLQRSMLEEQKNNTKALQANSDELKKTRENHKKERDNQGGIAFHVANLLTSGQW